MATLTASAALANVQPRNYVPGMITVPFTFNSGSTEISASATTILLCKIPNKATIVDYVEHHTTGAGTCPVDFGVTGSISALGTAQAQATVNRSNKAGGVPYKVSLSDSASNQFVYFTATATPGTGTASLKIQGSVTYTMDGL
jgi:hypothetical protein